MTDIQEMSVRQLHKAPGEDTLWACVEAFQNERFRTVSGLPYSYHLKIGRRGVYTKELFVDRREKSKSITWKTVMQAFEAVRQEKKERPLIARPKALGDVWKRKSRTSEKQSLNRAEKTRFEAFLMSGRMWKTTRLCSPKHKRGTTRRKSDERGG